MFDAQAQPCVRRGSRWPLLLEVCAHTSAEYALLSHIKSQIRLYVFGKKHKHTMVGGITHMAKIGFRIPKNQNVENFYFGEKSILTNSNN